MLDDKTKQSDPNASPEGADPTTAPISIEEMMTGISQQMGGPPTNNPEFKDATAVEMSILEDQFEAKMQRTYDNLGKEVKSAMPDATENQVHEIGKAFMEGNVSAGIKAIKQAARQEAEVDKKTQEQKSLHVEGGAGGKGTEDGKLPGLGGALSRIGSSYAGRSRT